VEKLQQFDFGQSMQYVKGKENVGHKELFFWLCMKRDV
jgi:hypothetical protein